MLNPTVIIEVLSKSTQDYDRGDKFTFYRSIPSFQEYILIDQYKIHLEQFSKLDDINWNFRTYGPNTPTLTFTSLDLSLPIADIYEDVPF
ncbi:MAG: Uma2 family endonuclease [Prochlorothrix sp.]